jgi:type IV secretory pathway TraG/TraD family ATPase VirD4
MNVFLVVLLVVLIGLGCLAVPARQLPAHRVRHAKLRMQLRLRPGRGHATLLELWCHWGRLASLRRSAHARPSLSFGQRWSLPSAHSILIGRAHFRHALRVPVEEHVLIMAPPRTGKSGLLASVIMHYPGPVLSTTTKADVYRLTSGLRSRVGPIHVFNPQGIGGVASTFRWNPLDGCADQAVAIRRADGFAKAVSMGGVEDANFWSSKASDYLRAFFHAAALINADMHVVARWVGGSDADVPVDILRAAGQHQWAQTVAELVGEAQKTVQTIRMTMSRALAFMTDPALAQCVLPGPGTGFDIEAFLRDCGTLYLIAEADHDDSPVAPLFACMANEIHRTAALLGQSMPGSRLDPPLLMALDEIVQTCPVPLPTWLADSGGKGIQILPVAHGEAQLASRWKDHGKQVIFDTCGVKLFLRGISDTKTLEMAAKLCGQAAYKERGQDHLSRHDVMTADMIRQLPDQFVLVIRGGLSPVVAKIPLAWKDRAYRLARSQGTAVAAVKPVAEAEQADALKELVAIPQTPNGHSSQNGHKRDQPANDFPWS